MKTHVKLADYKVYTSPRRRALKLTQAITASYEVYKNLAEMNVGIFEGMTLESVKKQYPEAYQAYMTTYQSYRIPGGETFKEFTDRVDHFYDNQVRGQDQIVVVTHGNVLRRLIERVLDLPPGGGWDYDIKPGGIFTYGNEE